jgi:hypothetical protein
MLFKNRSIVMRVVDDKETIELEGPVPPRDPVKVAREVTKCACFVIGAYVVADTFRQVTIYTAMTKMKTN